MTMKSTELRYLRNSIIVLKNRIYKFQLTISLRILVCMDLGLGMPFVFAKARSLKRLVPVVMELCHLPYVRTD